MAMFAAILHAHADECLLPGEPYLLVPTLCVGTHCLDAPRPTATAKRHENALPRRVWEREKGFHIGVFNPFRVDSSAAVDPG